MNLSILDELQLIAEELQRHMSPLHIYKISRTEIINQIQNAVTKGISILAKKHAVGAFCSFYNSLR